MKSFNLGLYKFTFSGDIINEYWVKLMAIKAMTYLKEHFFSHKTDTERKYLKIV